MKMWITKNKGGLVFLWLHKPFYKESCNMWFDYENGVVDEDNLRFGLYLGRNIFPEVTFENSPQEVELKLVNNVQGKVFNLHYQRCVDKSNILL